MKKLLKLLTLPLGLLALFAVANCGNSSDDVGDTTYNNFFDDVYTLQGTVMDATTGARLGDDDSFQMFLIQGSSHRRPDVLITSATSPLLGEYAFDNIPEELVGGNVIFKLVAVQDGYQQFEALIDFDASSNDANLNNTLDTDYNFIGDVYLFPLGATAPDVEVLVEYDGEPVEGATVVLQVNNGNHQETANTTSNRLPQYNGILESLEGTTDADGRVIFAGDDLVLGGSYTPYVLPITYETISLEREEGSAIIVGSAAAGTTVHTQVIALQDLVPGDDDEGLYVVFASNYDVDDLSADGELVLVFNRAVEILDSDLFSASLNNNVTAVLDTVPLNIDLSSDGLTLTLTPNYSTDPETDEGDASYDSDLEIVYSGSVVLLDDEGDQPIDLTTLEYANGSSLDVAGLTVQILPACSGCDAN